MQPKWGFSDGEATPEGVEVYREVDVHAVNRLAEQMDSQVRAVAYDRPGVHNWCLILFGRVEAIKRDETLAGKIHDFETVDPDGAMEEAISQAHDLGLDDYVRVTMEIEEAFEEMLRGLKPDSGV
jgi:hypothetical protein